MADRAVVVGSGAGGSTAAMVLAEAGWDVLVLEKGPSLLGDLTSPTPATSFSNDELKSRRYFEDPDPLAFPRTYRHADGEDPAHVGFVNHLPETVGGGTVHWDAKVPRFWDIDFKKQSMLGPVPDADVVDWPVEYADLAPFYDEVETLIGTAGDVDAMWQTTLAHAPRDRGFPMPPGPDQRSSSLLADGARAVGLHPYPFPMAINSVPYDGRPACNNCGFCSQYGCPIHARVGALAPLRRALLTGRVEVRPESFVVRVVHADGHATGVEIRDPDGRARVVTGDLVVLAASPVETSRLALLSAFPDPHDLVGRFLMFHWFTSGVGVFLRERLHAYRGRSTTQCVEDPCDPDFPGARAAAQAAGLPYLRGGILELGGTQMPLAETDALRFIMQAAAAKPFGSPFKQLLRASILRDRLNGTSMVGEDLAQATNRVDLDPDVTDVFGVPVARVTYAPHLHEEVASRFYQPILTAMSKAAGADVAFAIQNVTTDRNPVGQEDVPGGAHVLGGMRFGDDPATSVCDEIGMVRGLDNVAVADGSVFPTSGAQNPTLTVMALTLHNARRWVGGSSSDSTEAKDGVTPTPESATPSPLPVTGGGATALAAGALAAGAGLRRSEGHQVDPD